MEKGQDSSPNRYGWAKRSVAVLTMSATAIAVVAPAPTSRADLPECRFAQGNTVQKGEAVHIFDGVVMVPKQRTDNEFIVNPIVTFDKKGWVRSVAYVSGTEPDQVISLNYLPYKEMQSALWLKNNAPTHINDCQEGEPQYQGEQYFRAIVSEGAFNTPLSDGNDTKQLPVLHSRPWQKNGALHTAPPTRPDVEKELCKNHSMIHVGVG